MGRGVMIVLFYVVCVASLLFFAAFLLQISSPGRTRRKEPVVRKASRSEAVEPAAGKKWLIHLERQMAEFLLQNKSTVILLVVLAISSASLVAQDQGGPPDEQRSRQTAQQSTEFLRLSISSWVCLSPLNTKSTSSTLSSTANTARGSFSTGLQAGIAVALNIRGFGSEVIARPNASLLRVNL